jgi:hypothetical protein
MQYKTNRLVSKGNLKLLRELLLFLYKWLIMNDFVHESVIFIAHHIIVFIF